MKKLKTTKSSPTLFLDVALKSYITRKSLGGGGGPKPWVGKGDAQYRGSFGRKSPQWKRRLGSQLSIIQNCNLMTINKNTPVTSASQLSIFVQNVRSLGTHITSTKFTRPLDSRCDARVDARVTEPRLRQLWSNLKVRMSDMQVYNTYS